MNDSRLIAEVAGVWVDGGGDAAGIAWCADRLRIAVQDEIDRRADHANARMNIAASKAAYLANLERANAIWEAAGLSGAKGEQE